MEKRFEWNNRKNTANIKKHGVSFIEAAAVFHDPNRYEMLDQAHSYFEERWMVVGLSSAAILKVCFTERYGAIRIISARKADKNEEKRYLNGYSTFNAK
ncbi:MAG: BrnT family toxin [Treponema sp.]|nr:BrnT family toxin [Treponema sp.]